jgi:GNAT superfamily N-acetyltransferase
MLLVRARLPLSMFADSTLARRIERAEAAMSVAMVEGVCRQSGAESTVVPVGAGFAIYAGAGSPFNKIIGAGLDDGPLDEPALDAAERVCAAHGAPVRAEVCVLADPDVFAAFSRRGYVFETVEHVLGMTLPANDGVPVPLQGAVEIAQVEGEAGSNQWIEVLVDGFSVPDVTDTGVTGESFPADVLRETFRNYRDVEAFHRYLARLDGRPAGGGGLYLGGGIGFLCGAATLAPFRRRGVQAALLRRRLADAAAAGCDLAVVTTAPGSKSQQNAQRHGLSLLYARAVLVRPA